MNDPNKAIDVNLSSLLSLKAELLRKQAEVTKVKATRSTNDEYSTNYSVSKGNPVNKDKKPRSKDTREDEDSVKVYEHEDTALLEKSQKVLQAKAKFYERMTRTGGQLNGDDHCLVLFNRKKQEEKEGRECSQEPYHPAMGRADSSSDSDSDESDADSRHEDQKNKESDSEKDWVEYTDCLGRTRKCLRQDLESAKKRDAELAKSMPERLDQTKANWMIDTKGSYNDDKNAADDDEQTIGPFPPAESIYSDGCSLISKHDEQRSNWEKKEQENLDKPDVHYQDVFFDEARQHGVGYYAFSTDEEERRKQQRELEELRQRTLDEQEERARLRAQRDKIIQERVRAAKNRQRARLGLPPLDEEEEQKAQQKEDVKETKEERKERKRLEKLKRKQEKEEREREKEREHHVRPWDKEKIAGPQNSTEGFAPASEPEWQYRPDKEPLSQQEWNELKRAERNPEFAPPTEREERTRPLKRTNFSSMPPPQVPPMAYNMVPPPASVMDNGFNNFQSSKRNRPFQRRNYTDEYCKPDDQEAAPSRMGAAIPPPANLNDNCRLPPYAKRPKTTEELERSIDAGLRFIRENCDKNALSTKSSWTAKADY